LFFVSWVGVINLPPKIPYKFSSSVIKKSPSVTRRAC
jgi:hypothetical protein